MVLDLSCQITFCRAFVECQMLVAFCLQHLDTFFMLKSLRHMTGIYSQNTIIRGESPRGWWESVFQQHLLGIESVHFKILLHTEHTWYACTFVDSSLHIRNLEFRAHWFTVVLQGCCSHTDCTAQHRQLLYLWPAVGLQISVSCVLGSVNHIVGVQQIVLRSIRGFLRS